MSVQISCSLPGELLHVPGQACRKMLLRCQAPFTLLFSIPHLLRAACWGPLHKEGAWLCPSAWLWGHLQRCARQELGSTSLAPPAHQRPARGSALLRRLPHAPRERVRAARAAPALLGGVVSSAGSLKPAELLCCGQDINYGTCYQTA